jgi:hypothetical protein
LAQGGWRKLAANFRRFPAFLLALLVAWSLASERALAQDGFHVTPTLTVAELYDDDLYPQSAGAAKALVLRLSPQLIASYRSERLTVVGRAADVLDWRSEHFAPWAQRTGDLQFRALATKRLTLSGGATFSDTNTPRDLNVQTGFDPGVVQTQSLKVGSAVAYRLDALSEGTVAYDFNRTVQTGLLTDIHVLEPGIHAQLTERDTGRADVLVRRFVFHGYFAQTSVVPLLGWGHQVTPEISFTLLGGPRFTQGALEDAEASASIRQDMKKVHTALAYARTQTTVGLLGTLNTNSVSATVAYEPFDRLRLSAAPAIFASAGAALEAKVLQLKVDAAYTVNAWFVVAGTYRYSVQQVNHLDAAPLTRELSHHNFLLLSVSFNTPSRDRF